jgi:cysteine protease ATG4
MVSTATLTYDTLRFAEFEDFPETSEPVWILGRKYSIFTGIVLWAQNTLQNS